MLFKFLKDEEKELSLEVVNEVDIFRQYSYLGVRDIYER